MSHLVDGCHPCLFPFIENMTAREGQRKFEGRLTIENLRNALTDAALSAEINLAAMSRDEKDDLLRSGSNALRHRALTNKDDPNINFSGIQKIYEIVQC